MFSELWKIDWEASEDGWPVNQPFYRPKHYSIVSTLQPPSSVCMWTLALHHLREKEKHRTWCSWKIKRAWKFQFITNNFHRRVHRTEPADSSPDGGKCDSEKKKRGRQTSRKMYSQIIHGKLVRFRHFYEETLDESWSKCSSQQYPRLRWACGAFKSIERVRL